MNSEVKQLAEVENTEGESDSEIEEVHNESSEDEESKDDDSEAEDDQDTSDDITSDGEGEIERRKTKAKSGKAKTIKRKKTLKNYKKEKLYINVQNTRYPIIKEAARGLGYKATYKEDKDWDIIWHDGGVSSEKLSKLHDYQRINHFPGMYILARKNYLAINIMKMARVFDKEYKIAPATWLLPTDWSSFMDQFNKKRAKTFIVKPEASCQGRGIFLTRNYKNLDRNEHYVVQRYLHKPYLIDDLKFDLRIYVLL